MMRSSTSELTILLKAAPMITPTARSTTFPRIAKSRNSRSIFASISASSHQRHARHSIPPVKVERAGVAPAIPRNSPLGLVNEMMAQAVAKLLILLFPGLPGLAHDPWLARHRCNPRLSRRAFCRGAIWRRVRPPRQRADAQRRLCAEPRRLLHLLDLLRIGRHRLLAWHRIPGDLYRPDH